MEAVDIIALTLGVAWASGINLYAAILTLGLLGATGNIVLPPGLVVLMNPAVIGAAALMYCIEFFADKFPGLDSAWDAVHTFIRIPAAAVLAAQAVGDVDPALQLAAALIGGALATATHAGKAGSRMLINASPEPFTNWAASVTEDVAVVAGVWAAASHPIVFLTALVLFMAALVWLLPKIWRALRRMLGAIARFFRGGPQTAPDPPGDAPLPPPR